MTLSPWLVFRIGLLLLFVAASLFFFYASPEELILYIGVENVYALMFVLAFLGGLTTFSGIPFHIVLITLAAGGVNPLLLGITAASGVILGDTTSYFLGYSGSSLVPETIKKLLNRFCAFCLAHPKLMPLTFFLYGSLVPFSNDFIVISMGLAHYPFWRVMIPLALGNFVFNITLAYVAVYAYQFLAILGLL